jgi:hypothetical protein
MQLAGAGFGNHDCVGKYGAGFAVAPVRIKQVDVEGEDHARLEFAADGRERRLIGLERMKAIPRIFKRGQAVAMDTGLADAKLGVVDDALDLAHAGGDRLAWAEQFHAAPECGDTTVVDSLQFSVGLAEAKGALDVGEIAASLRMDLAGDEVSRLHRPRCRQTKRMRERVAVAGPQKQGTVGLAVDANRSAAETGFVLADGQSAVIADVSEDWTTPVDSKMRGLGGTVYRRAKDDLEDDASFVGDAYPYDYYLYPYEYIPPSYAVW